VVTAGAGVRPRGTDLLVLLGLAIVAALVFGRVLDVRPLGEDNFYVFSWIDGAHASNLLRLDPSIYPEWRPLAYQTIWLQYQWAGLARMADYYVVNIGVWVLTAWLVYRISVHLTGSLAASCVAALFVLTEPRASPAVAWVVERQASMACLFGLLACWIVVRADARRLAPAELAVAGVALLASALSKEYGLAFSGALVVYAWMERRRELAAIALGAGVMYGALRLVFAGGAAEPYCGDLGFFFAVRKGGCYQADLASAAQMLYNVVATGIGSFVRGLFTGDGRIGIARLPLLLSLCWLVVTIAGWRRGPRAMRLALLAIAGNTVLSFLLYEPRNQLVAVAAIGLLIGAGVAVLTMRGPTPMRTGVVIAVAALLAIQTVRTHSAVSEEVDQLLQQDPCSYLVEHPTAVPFAERVKSRYGGHWECGTPR